MKKTLIIILIAFVVLILIGLSCLLLILPYFMKSNETPAPEATPVPTNSEMLETESDIKLTTSDVQYFNDINGYFAMPSEEGNYPGVVMIHEWWGLNDEIKAMADQLAKEGYYVLAVDLHKGEVADTPDRARELTGSLDQVEAVDNLKAAVTFLKAQGATKIASLGWCFGGGQSLQLAISGEPLDATVIYYGSLITDEAKLEPIDWPVLGIFGDKDQSISVDTVKAFETSLNEADIENDIYIYEGVGHAFANPSGANYAPDETKDAWEKTTAFLSENLK